MKLSEAIRDGAKLSPQAFGDYIKVVPDSEVPATCAIGAAYHALTHELPWSSDEPGCPVERTVREGCGLDDLRIPDPIDEGRPGTVLVVVIGLNDDARWTREAIADYLEGQGL